MMTAFKTSPADVAIRFQPANDGSSLSASDIPMIAGLLRHDARRWPEQAAWQESSELGALASGEQATVAARHDALLHLLAVEEAERVRVVLRSGEVACRIHGLRDRFGLHSAAAMKDWLSAAGLTFERLASFFEAEIFVEELEQLWSARIEHELDLHRALLSACAGLGRPAAGPDGDEIAALMGHDDDERALRRRVLLRILASRELGRTGMQVDRRDVEEMSDRFRECFGLFQASEMMSWLTFSGLSQESFTEQMQAFTSVLKLDRERSAEIADRMALGQAVKTIAAWAERRAP